MIAPSGAASAARASRHQHAHRRRARDPLAQDTREDRDDGIARLRVRKVVESHAGSKPRLACSATSHESKTENNKDVAMPPNTLPNMRTS